MPSSPGDEQPQHPVIGPTGHFDRFGQMPLAKRSALNGDWIDDGVNLRWQPHLDGGWGCLDTIEIGGWPSALRVEPC